MVVRMSAPPLLAGNQEIIACFVSDAMEDVFEDEPGRCSAAKLPSKDEARWIASNIKKAAETADACAAH
jgi:hypothetical protein